MPTSSAHFYPSSGPPLRPALPTSASTCSPSSGPHRLRHYRPAPHGSLQVRQALPSRMRPYLPLKSLQRLRQPARRNHPDRLRLCPGPARTRRSARPSSQPRTRHPTCGGSRGTRGQDRLGGVPGVAGRVERGASRVRSSPPRRPSSVCRSVLGPLQAWRTHVLTCRPCPRRGAAACAAPTLLHERADT